MESFSTEAGILKCIPSNFFWKFAEVFGQHLNSLFWKIVLAYHTTDKDHPVILYTVFPSFFFVFVSYINRNHKDTTHTWGRWFDTTLYIDQNVTQACQPEFLKIWRVQIFLFKKAEDFSLNRDILKSQKKLDSRLFLYSFSQYPHQ